MRQEINFVLPNDAHMVARLINSIPISWSCVDGRLEAPESLFGEVAEHTGLKLSRFYSIHPTLEGKYLEGNHRHLPADLFDIFIMRKYPGFIIFDEAGFECYELPFDEVRKLAAAFMELGYRGHLHFYSGFRNNSKADYPERCTIIANPWELYDGPNVPRIQRPPMVLLRWDEKFEGKRGNLEPIISACNDCGLRELTPLSA